MSITFASTPLIATILVADDASKKCKHLPGNISPQKKKVMNSQGTRNERKHALAPVALHLIIVPFGCNADDHIYLKKPKNLHKIDSIYVATLAGAQYL